MVSIPINRNNDFTWTYDISEFRIDLQADYGCIFGAFVESYDPIAVIELLDSSSLTISN